MIDAMNPNKSAVIETGGKQYLVQPGQTLKIEKLKDAKEGGKISFDNVLLIIDGEDIKHCQRKFSRPLWRLSVSQF